MSRVDLGIDTGGTFTDAVLMGEGRVIASAKALTTRDDLARGITQAVRAVLTEAALEPGAIGFAALSTTLATNALIEGHGGRAGLVAIGFDEAALTRAGLIEALRGEPYLCARGGHGHAGEEARPLDLDAILDWAKAQTVDAFAIASEFATRNPAHELAAGAAIREATGRPVTLSHTLSSKLGGPKRAPSIWTRSSPGPRRRRSTPSRSRRNSPRATRPMNWPQALRSARRRGGP